MGVDLVGTSKQLTGQNSEHQDAYGYFIYHALLGTTFASMLKIKHHSCLRSFNVLVKGKEGALTLVVPNFLIFFFGMEEVVGVVGKQGNKGAHMEFAVVACLNAKYGPALEGLIPGGVTLDVPLTLSPARGPKVHTNGQATLEDIKAWPDAPFTHNLPPHLLGSFLHSLPLGQLVVMADQSSSADCVVRVGERAVVEIQCKARKTPANLALVKREILKSVVHGCPEFTSTFVFTLASGCTKGVREALASGELDKGEPKVVVPSVAQLETFFWGEEMLKKFSS
jgi:hypothetical protein